MEQIQSQLFRLNIENNQQVESFSVLMSFIISTYFFNLRCTCFVKKFDYSNSVFDAIIELDIPVVWIDYDESSLMELDDSVKSCIDLGCESFIISEKVWFDFFQSYINVKDNCDRRLIEPYFIIHQLDRTKANWSDLLQHQLIRGKSSDDKSFELLTTDSIGRSPKIILLDYFYYNSSGFQQNEILFPDKLKNLNKEIVKLAIFNYQPYTVWKNVTSGTGNANDINSEKNNTLYIDGTETLMMIEFCLKFNCTLDVSTDDIGEWGEIFNNYTGNGVLGALVERRADIGVGALYAWYHEYKFLSFSTPITRTGITCLVLKPKILSGWLLPIFPFSTYLWIAVLISSIIGIISLKSIRELQEKLSLIEFPVKQLSFGETIFFVLQIYVLQSAKIMYNHLSDAIITFCILLIGLMIGNAYGCGLSSVMTVPQYEEAIETIEQLADSKLDWAATHDAWIFSIQLSPNPMMKSLVAKFKTYSKEILADRMRAQNLFFSIERLPYGHFAIGEYITEENLENYQIMHEDIYWESCVAMTSKTWPLLSKFNDLVLHIVQSGIQKAWELNIVTKTSDSKVQLGVAASKSKHHDNTEPVALQINQLTGGFGVLVIGLSISLLVFIGELIYYLYIN